MTSCGFSGVALVVLGAGAATAGATPVRIELDAPAGCADAAGFLERLRARTDRVRPARDAEAALTISVKLSRLAGKVHGELSMKQEPSDTATRKVDGASCDEVVNVLSLTAALALERLVPAEPKPDAGRAGSDGASRAGSDGTAAAGATATNSDAKAVAEKKPTAATPEKAAPSATPQAPALAPAEKDRPAPVAKSPSGNGGRVRIEGGAELAMTQVVSPGWVTGVGALLRVHALGASATTHALYWSSALGGSGGIEARGFGLGLSACPGSWTVGKLALEPCALGRVTWMNVSDEWAINARDADRALWSAGLLGRARLPLGAWLSLGLDAGASVSLVKRRFAMQLPERIIAETPTISPFIGLAALLSP
ncbi:MAG: hypothetical protein QM756_46575 [Polyangiaceae bacterium]